MISVRDMFAGGLSASCKRMSVVCGQLLVFIAGKMTPVMQIADVAVAFLLKKIFEATKADVRRAKRGGLDGIELAVKALEANPSELKCDTGDLMRILGRSWAKLKHQDEVDEPDRLLKATRACGWLSYRADPVRKALVRCDEEDWMKGREAELLEETHRHPAAWWEERYRWLGEDGEPRKPEWKTCGRRVQGLQYMVDEFPEQAPDEKTKLHCLTGRKIKTLPFIDLTDEDTTFPEVARNLVPAEFLRSQREKFEEARMRALMSKTDSWGKKKAGRTLKARRVALRAKTKRKLMRQKKKQKPEFVHL